METLAKKERASHPAPGTGDADSLVGTTINGRYEILEFVAKGGMGRVYRGKQLPLGRVCAVKVLHPALGSSDISDFQRRFFLEASVASKLTHPNTVTVYDYGKADGDRYFMAMEFLEGGTLKDAIRAAGHFPQERALHVARQICRSLREAHAMGVIHRDLKPANVFLIVHGDEADFVKVLDFGLVKDVNEVDQDHTQAGVCMGSPKYMAPEQIAGDAVDARTDVYALGVVLYEMLTGRVPFDRGNHMATLMAHVSDPVPPLRSVREDVDVSPELEAVILRCLAKRADDRFANMDELLSALKLQGLQMTSGAYSDPSTSALSMQLPSGLAHTQGVPEASPGRSRGGFIAALGAVGVAAVVAIVLSSRRGETAPSAAAGPAVPQTTSAPATAAPSAVAGLPKIRIETEPPGASVKEDGVEVCAQTPCDLEYHGKDAAAGREHKLVIASRGYKVETRTARVGETVAIALAKVAAPVAPAPVHRPAAAPAAPSKPGGDMPSGYKVDIPY